VRRAALGVYVISLCYPLLATFAILTRDAAIVASQESDTNLTDAEIVAAVNGLVVIAVVVGGVAIAVHALVIVSGAAALVLLHRRASNAFFAQPLLP